MAVRAYEVLSQELSGTSRVRSTVRRKRRVMSWPVLLVLLLIPTTASSITIVKKVGHGDCYVVISDGRVIVIDVGRTTNVNGLVSLLRTGYTHFDRIVITHVHSDHVGGLITAERYAREQPNAALSTDMLISNHGEHDLNLVLRHERVGPLMAQLRNRPIVGMNDQAIAKLALNTPHLEVRGIALGGAAGASSENKSGLILKVTEIRDGKRRATLFLGDIEKAQQRELFDHPDAKEIFRDVAAVTLPHHGRPRTLLPEFFSEIKKLSSIDLVALHSDATALDGKIAREAAVAGIKIISAASPRNNRTEVIVNLFAERTYYQVGKQPTLLSAIVKNARGDSLAASDVTVDEVVEAVAKYSNRSAEVPLQPGTIISMPSDTWIGEEIRNRRATTDQQIAQLRSGNREEMTRADRLLSKLVYKLTEKQRERINEISPGSIERWETENATPAEREIRAGLARGWVVANNNIDEEKLFIQTKWRNEDTPGISKYIVEDGPNNTWSIFTPGPKNGKGMTSVGKSLGTMRRPTAIDVEYYELCEYCGRKAVGWCHIREKTVCSRHRYFTQSGVNWQCP